MDRVWIRGTTGAGKTTLAGKVAARSGAPMIDLDDLFWLPGWQARTPEDFVARVEQAAAGPRWVIVGNYTKVGPIMTPRAQEVVWLDYSLPLCFSRVLRRTLRRGITRETCYNGNRESMLKSFFTRRSILYWCLTTHARRHQDCLAFMVEAPPVGQARLRHRSPRETRQWLGTVSDEGTRSV